MIVFRKTLTKNKIINMDYVILINKTINKINNNNCKLT